MGIEGRRLFLQQCAGVGALGGSRAQRDARGDYSVAHSVSTPGCIAIGITVAWYLACARGAISRRSAQRHTQTVGLCCSAVQCFAPPRVRIIVAGEVVRWLCGGRSVGFLSFVRSASHTSALALLASSFSARVVLALPLALAPRPDPACRVCPETRPRSRMWRHASCARCARAPRHHRYCTRTVIPTCVLNT